MFLSFQTFVNMSIKYELINEICTKVICNVTFVRMFCKLISLQWNFPLIPLKGDTLNSIKGSK